MNNARLASCCSLSLHGSHGRTPFRSCSLHSLPSKTLDSELSVSGNALDLGKIPLLVAEGADTPGLQPALDAIEVKDVAAVSKGYRQTVVVGRRRIGLVLDRGLVQRVSADRACVGTNVPRPHGHRVPFLDLEPRVCSRGGFGGGFGLWNIRQYTMASKQLETIIAS